LEIKRPVSGWKEVAIMIERREELYLNRRPEQGKDVRTLAEATGSSACEPVEKAAKTSAAHYFELRYAWPE
jgi:hypothetical protein